MALHFRTTGMPGPGMFVENITHVVVNAEAATAMTLGQHVIFDLFDTATTTTGSTVDGNAGAVTANVILATAAGIGKVGAAAGADIGYLSGIVTSLLDGTGQPGEKIQVTTSGKVQALLDNTAILKGSCLIAQTTGSKLKLLPATTVAGARIVGRSLEANSSTAGTYWILFDGEGLSGQIYDS